jgi:hypothetical protein
MITAYFDVSTPLEVSQNYFKNAAGMKSTIYLDVDILF